MVRGTQRSAVGEWPEEGGWAATFSRKTGHKKVLINLILDTAGKKWNPIDKKKLTVR